MDGKAPWWHLLWIIPSVIITETLALLRVMGWGKKSKKDSRDRR